MCIYLVEPITHFQHRCELKYTHWVGGNKNMNNNKNEPSWTELAMKSKHFNKNLVVILMWCRFGLV